ncbi:HNH endonuclease signature motif containing protein [Cupriavidus sp. L7L]|uniref:HNH endonuclease n=1 Tax=Cupriavidus sp. L7L TaxID=2546443 RepID=UPI001FB71454|nr:HNH endonuclease signature motif containing protein [Cupriavidus sp. L7L]
MQSSVDIAVAGEKLRIPHVTQATIRSALDEFDRVLRGTQKWADWETKKSQLYAISDQGMLYPPKQILSMATGVPVSHFSGGVQTNAYLENLGFGIVRLPNGSLPFGGGEPPTFVLGRIYHRQTEIHHRFGGSRQSGIAPSSKVPAIFIFTGESGEQYGYFDGRDELGMFSYTGEGQVGDMEFKRGNLAIRDHAANGQALHLFKSLGKGKGQEYLGEHTYGGHAIRQGPDKDGTQRDIIVFQLVPVALLDEESVTLPEDEATDGPAPTSLEEARKRALEAIYDSSNEMGRAALRKLYRRSKRVKDYVLLRAEGICESCRQPAPFKRKDGSAYLEPHHTTRVSDGGLDHPRYVAAICPACHRHIHHGVGGEEKNLELIFAIAAKEPEA